MGFDWYNQPREGNTGKFAEKEPGNSRMSALCVRLTMRQRAQLDDLANRLQLTITDTVAVALSRLAGDGAGVRAIRARQAERLPEPDPDPVRAAYYAENGIAGKPAYSDTTRRNAGALRDLF